VGKKTNGRYGKKAPTRRENISTKGEGRRWGSRRGSGSVALEGGGERLWGGFESRVKAAPTRGHRRGKRTGGVSI